MLFWIKNFLTPTLLKNPNHLWAIKVTSATLFLLLLFQYLGFPEIGTYMGMGVVAMAVTEKDVHPRGQIKSVLIAILSFFIASVAVELLRTHTLIFGIWLTFFTFIFTLLGGISTRYQGITFGSLLIMMYTLLGQSTNLSWYHQPIYYVAGALVYAVISIGILYLNPTRLLNEEMASGYQKLADYISQKAKLFPSTPEMQDEIKNELAQKNLALATQIEQIKNDLFTYTEESSDQSKVILDNYYRNWVKLQQMHERATSSHEQYDLLTKNTENIELIQGFGKLMDEISLALKKYSECLLTGETYHHPIALSWTASAMKNMLSLHKNEPAYPVLKLLLNNLTRLEDTLKSEDQILTHQEIEQNFYNKKSKVNSIKKLFNPANPRFRFATRLTLCMLAGYILINAFKIEKGDWVLLTSLIVCQQTYSATRMRLLHRVLGTLIGVILGIALTKLMPSLTGQILIFIVAVYLDFYWLKKNYTVAVVFITVFVLASFNIQSNAGVLVMWPRIIDTIIGSFLAFLAVRFIWPEWQYKELPQVLRNAISSNINYFESIYLKTIPYQEFLEFRNIAHQADNALTAAWQGMRLEPKSKQKYIRYAYNLTLLNHSLISYISAFGVNRGDKQLNEDELVTCEEVSFILKSSQQIWTENLSEEEIEIRLNQINSIIQFWKENPSENQLIILVQHLGEVGKDMFYEVAKLSKKLV